MDPNTKNTLYGIITAIGASFLLWTVLIVVVLTIEVVWAVFR